MDSRNQEEVVDPPSPKPIEKKSKKKRKREKSAKEEINVKVNIINEKPDKTPPIVAYFASGYNPSSTKRDRGQQEPNIKVYRNKVVNRTERLEVVVSPPGSNVEFVGSSHEGEGYYKKVCVYTLGILDKATQTLKIVPIAANKIIRLEPKIGGLESDDEEPSAAISEMTPADRAERTRKLTSLYGSKTSINRDKKRQDLMHKGDDPGAQQHLDNIINAVEIKETDESTSTTDYRNIPPYNVLATTPEEAYPLDQIIFDGEWDFLEDVYNLLYAEAGVSTDSYPSFVRNRMFLLREMQEEEKKKIACIFSFMTHLIKFKDLHSMDGYTSAKDHRIPAILRDRFKTLFADSESKRLQDDKQKLLIGYVLVLSLYADGFRTDPADIAKDLRISPVLLRPLLENLGCKFSRVNSVYLACLRVPLQFPEVRRKRRR